MWLVTPGCVTTLCAVRCDVIWMVGGDIRASKRTTKELRALSFAPRFAREYRHAKDFGFALVGVSRVVPLIAWIDRTRAPGPGRRSTPPSQDHQALASQEPTFDRVRPFRSPAVFATCRRRTHEQRPLKDVGPREFIAPHSTHEFENKGGNAYQFGQHETEVNSSNPFVASIHAFDVNPPRARPGGEKPMSFITVASMGEASRTRSA